MENLQVEIFGNIIWVEIIDLILFFYYNYIDKEVVFV